MYDGPFRSVYDKLYPEFGEKMDDLMDSKDAK